MNYILLWVKWPYFIKNLIVGLQTNDIFNTSSFLYALLVGAYYGMARASVRLGVCLWVYPQSL